MRTILAITRKEMEQYFASPVAYVVVFLYLVLSGVFFYVYLGEYIRYSQMAGQMGGDAGDVTQSIMRPFFANASFFFLIIFPMMTMKLLAEEKKLGTYELLMTSPISVPQLVLGKFLGAFALMLTILILIAVNPIILFIFGSPDLGPVLTGFLGLLLIGGTFLAMGLLCSSLTENQIVAAILGFVVGVIFWILSFVARGEGWFSKFAQYASIYQRFDDFTQGILKLNDVVYYLTFIGFALFTTGIILQSQRWK